jgi:hypothetical protein
MKKSLGKPTTISSGKGHSTAPVIFWGVGA